MPQDCAIEWLKQVQSDFDRIRWDCEPTKAVLVHQATNAEAEGVSRFPIDERRASCVQGAGRRDFYQRTDASGNPLFCEEPTLDVQGHPFTNSAGRAFDVVMPAFRTICFFGSPMNDRRLQSAADRVGHILKRLQCWHLLPFLAGWTFARPRDLWWACVFEMAWTSDCPTLAAERRIWLPEENPSVFLPYDLAYVRRAAAGESPSPIPIPDRWNRKLPDAYMSEINDVATASFDLVGHLQNKTKREHERAEETPQFIQVEGSCDKLAQPKIQRRFAVALSFPGTHRDLVRSVAEILQDSLGTGRVFFDEYFKAELARMDLDLHLQQIYGDDSELIVVFVCGAYQEKEWCVIEWRRIREIMKANDRTSDSVMFLRIDHEPLEGFLSIDGYLDVSEMKAKDIAREILKRSGTYHTDSDLE